MTLAGLDNHFWAVTKQPGPPVRFPDGRWNFWYSQCGCRGANKTPCRPPFVLQRQPTHLIGRCEQSERFSFGMQNATRAAASQYSTNEDGDRVIAASRRADGTVRKERRVRAGYVPPEEQRSYVSRGGQVRMLTGPWSGCMFLHRYLIQLESLGSTARACSSEGKQTWSSAPASMMVRHFQEQKTCKLQRAPGGGVAGASSTLRFRQHMQIAGRHTPCIAQRFAQVMR